MCFVSRMKDESVCMCSVVKVWKVESLKQNLAARGKG